VQSVRARFIEGHARSTQGESRPADIRFMKCPSCGTAFEKPVERCPHCKLSLQRLDMKFGLVPAHSRFLTDRTGKVPLDEMKELRAALRLFQKKFPQCLLSVFVTELPNGSSVSEYAFWMANRAKFASVETTQNENCNLLLIIDLTAEAAAIAVGYGLEPYVAEEELQKVLDQLANGIRDGGLSAGLRTCIDTLTRRLRELSAKARQPELTQTSA
jgi:uncharacterized membrane protein YgcG